MKILLKAIKANAVNRPDGYYEDCIAHGIVEGEFLTITTEGYNELLKKYRVKMRGLGDLVAVPANKIAGVMDRTLGTHIQGCSGCGKRQDVLNKLVPFK